MPAEILKKPEPLAVEELRGLGFSDGKRALENLKLLSKGPVLAAKGTLSNLLTLSLSSPSPDDALTNLERVNEAVPGDNLKKFLRKKEGLQMLVTLSGSSPYLSGILSKNPEWFEGIFIKGGLRTKKDLPLFRRELSRWAKDAEGFDTMAKALRRYRNSEYLRIGARDLLGLAPMEEITAELSDLASACLEAGVLFCIKEGKRLFGTPLYRDEDGSEKEAEFCVIGLGKLGGGELNFSSDIDIIYIYSSDKGETTGKEGREHTRLTPHAFFVKVAERLTKLISSPTGDGIVFRVDLNLRPEGKSGDVANSLRSAEIYYESWGQPWERSAMIKARPVAGSPELGARFIEMITPFVYRRHLDFTAIEEIRGMKEKIDASLLRTRPDSIDVKLGRGGIREVEFFCQALQLIYGGRDPRLRERNTLLTLEKLKQSNLAAEKDASTLKEGYVFLRNLEHRIQIKDGRQTQAIPAKPEALETLARMMGFKDTEGKRAGDYLREEYQKKTGAVHSVYRSLFYKSERALTEGVPEEVFILLSQETPREEALLLFKGLGFKDTEASYRSMKLLRDGTPFAHISARARALLERLSPLFIAKASVSADPDMALKNLERFVSSVGAKAGFFSMLAENPALAGELLNIFGSSDFLANTLIERPGNFDLFLSEELPVEKKTADEFKMELKLALSLAPDYEEKLDTLRRFRNEEVFRIGFNDTVGNLSPLEVSSQITALAEACLENACEMAFEGLQRKYGRPGDERFFITAMGKLGGGELVYGSDLDIFFVYSSAGEKTETTGPKVISNHEFFVLLAQKIISILSLRTKEGIAFNVDTRLRPSGSSGPLVVTKDSLLNYHREKAGVWERQAALKARFVTGDRAFGEEALRALSDIVCSRPLKKEDSQELVRIRRRMEAEVAKEGEGREGERRFDIKTGKGGMVDIEFLTQALQLNYGGANPALRTPNTLDALKRLTDGGITSKEEFEFLTDTYRFFRLLEIRLRIVHDSPACILDAAGPQIKTLARRLGYEGEERLLEDYIKRRDMVRRIYLKVMEGTFL